jgi:hypothetical protein
MKSAAAVVLSRHELLTGAAMSIHQPLKAGPLSGTQPGAPAHYIVYLLDAAGKIRSSDWIAAWGDEEALAQVRAFRLGSECELWQRDRRVGRVPAVRS